MNGKSILFSGEMVRAILDGRKTQTRRVINPQPYGLCADVPEVIAGHFLNRDLGWRFEDRDGRRSHNEMRCRYGIVGDQLWVRESFRELIDLGPGTNSSHNYYEYKADQGSNYVDFNPDVKWKPSIFMPREASRITLEIVSVRVERVQDITSDDVLAEGIKKTEVDEYWLAPLAGVPDYPWGHAQQAYASLWSSINDKRGYGWNVNPWVWVIEFKKLEKRQP